MSVRFRNYFQKKYKMNIIFRNIKIILFINLNLMKNEKFTSIDSDEESEKEDVVRAYTSITKKGLFNIK